MKHIDSYPCRRGILAAGFSLIEIVLALGIISFAIVAIMGMFPVALRSAQESQRETRAALIAQQIYGDLAASTNTTNRVVSVGTNLVTVNLATSSTTTIAYDVTGATLNSTNLANAIFAADVLVSPDIPFTGLSQVQTTVYTPPAAAVNAVGRSSYVFVTLFSRN
ncbi:hypothetical protein BH09VER1_BH09VER1_41350 [soil metagenome]